ncbi:MAG: tRNA pseudouridine(38-40) synthase TruA [Clostridiales bacterium]
MTKIKLKIAYDGTDFIGWQRQPLGRGLSVQAALEKALQRVFREKISLIASGRTDKGVHALGQVAHFCSDKALPIKNIAFAVNNILPPSIRILEAVEVDGDFHARYDAKRKTYLYSLNMDPLGSDNIFGGRYFWQLGKELNVQAMEDAAQLFLGSHDFRNFSARGNPIESYQREIFRLDIRKPLAGEIICPWQSFSKPLLLEVEGSGFLYKMVRLITARLVDIGLGKLQKTDIVRLLEGPYLPPKNPAPAHGLLLWQVEYGSRKSDIGD